MEQALCANARAEAMLYHTVAMPGYCSEMLYGVSHGDSPFSRSNFIYGRYELYSIQEVEPLVICHELLGML